MQTTRFPAAATRLLLALAAATALGHHDGFAERISCLKPEPPIQIRLTPVEPSPAAGRYRVQVEVDLDAPLEDVRTSVGLPRGGRLLLGAEQRQLPRGGRLREELLIGAETERGARLFVTVQGRLDGALLSRTASLDLGTVDEPELSGRERKDRRGQTYFEVPANGADTRGDR